MRFSRVALGIGVVATAVCAGVITSIIQKHIQRASVEVQGRESTQVENPRVTIRHETHFPAIAASANDKISPELSEACPIIHKRLATLKAYADEFSRVQINERRWDFLDVRVSRVGRDSAGNVTSDGMRLIVNADTFKLPVERARDAILASYAVVVQHQQVDAAFRENIPWCKPWSDAGGNNQTPLTVSSGAMTAAPIEQLFVANINGAIYGVAAHPAHGVYLLINNTSQRAINAKFDQIVMLLSDGTTVEPCCGYEKSALGFATDMTSPISVPSGGSKVYSLAVSPDQVEQGAYMRVQQRIVSISLKGSALCEMKSHADFDDATADGKFPLYCGDYAHRSGEAKLSNAKPPSEDEVIVSELSAGSRCSPSGVSTVRVTYVGSLDDGTIFDNQPMAVNSRLIGHSLKGWVIAVQRMSEGGEYSVVIPSDFAYGSKGQPPKIPPNANLNYRVKLLKIETAALCN